MHSAFPALIAAAILAAGPAAAPTAGGGNSFAIRDVRLFDGLRVVPRVNVVVRDGRVAAIGKDAAIPAGLAVIDGSGKTLLPGLIDSHVHVFRGAQADALRFGVTTELDMYNLTHEFAAWRAQRDGLGRTSEADTWSAGTGLSAPGGHPAGEVPPEWHVPTLTTPAEAGPFVRARVAEGSDYIKLIMEDLSFFTPDRRIPTLSPAVVCAGIAAAHRAGKLAIVHVTLQANARIAVRCGADGLAHLFADSLADRDFVRRARLRPAFVETTLTVVAAGSHLPEVRSVYDRDDVRALLSPAQKRTIAADFGSLTPHGIETALRSARMLHAAGIPLLAATDAPNPGAPHGIGLHVELRLLVDAGLTPREALTAATALPARIFHLGDRGRIARGFRADLLLVRGDPTTNIADSLAIERIWKNGFAVARGLPAA